MIDSSALVAILLDEPKAASFAESIERVGRPRMSAVSLLETSIVIQTRHGADGLLRLDLLVAEAGIEVVPFTARDARSARRAYRQFGKGLHPAALNFGDCISYALAADANEALLSKGDNFSKTDIACAAAREN